MNKKQRKAQKRQNRTVRMQAMMVWLHKIALSIAPIQPYTLWTVLEDFQRGRFTPAELKWALDNAYMGVAPTMQALTLMGEAMLKNKGLGRKKYDAIFTYAIYDYAAWVLPETLDLDNAWMTARDYLAECLRDEREAVRK